MDNARDFLCQSALPQGSARLFAAFVLAAMLVRLPAVSAADAPPSPSQTPPAAAASSPAPTPPAWQRDLGGVLAMQTVAALSAPASDADEKAREQKLADAYTQLGAKYPDQLEVQKACGDYFFTAEQGVRAFGYWQRAQTLDPKNADVAASLGGAYLKAGDTRAAAAQFQRAVDAQPDQAQFHSALANVLYLFRHDLVKPPAFPTSESVLLTALEHFRRAAELSPKDRELAKAYAETFYILANPDWPRALVAWQAVLALSAEDSDFANSHLARVNLRMKQPQEAEKYLDRLTRPDFMPLQAKLRAQAKKMEQADAATGK